MQRPAPEVSVLDELASGKAHAVPAAKQPSAAAANQQPMAPNADLALLQRLRRSGIPVVAVFVTGRVRGVTPELEASNAFAVAWLPGSEGGGIADVLFRKSDGAVNFPFTGKLSYAWPPLFANDYGLRGCIRH